MLRLTRRSLLSRFDGLSRPAPACSPDRRAPPAPTPVPLRGRGAPGARARRRALRGEPCAPLPEPLNRLDFDAYRDIRFRPERALLGSAGGPFRMQLFHLGFLYQRPVTVNVIRDGVPTPVPYQRAAVRLRPQQDRAAAAGEPRLCRLPPALPAERPARSSTSSSRSSARAISASSGATSATASRRAGSRQCRASGEPEEFPYFREFWVEMPAAGRRPGHRLRAARRPVGRRAPTASRSTRRPRPRSTSR